MVNMGQAVDHFKDALAFCHKAGYWPELAWTCRARRTRMVSGTGMETAPTLWPCQTGPWPSSASWACRPR